jgi:hypothetical protein
MQPQVTAETHDVGNQFCFLQFYQNSLVIAAGKSYFGGKIKTTDGQKQVGVFVFFLLGRNTDGMFL